MKLSTGINQKDQANTTLLNNYDVEIAQLCDEKINTLQKQFNANSVKENEQPVSLVSRRKRNPICKQCNLRKVHYDENSDQCKDCYRASLRALSGNKLLDNFIESTQTFHNGRNYLKLEFISYDQFTNIEYLAKGGFSVIYKATWVDGPIIRWNPKKQKYNRKGNYDVVLKVLNNSEKMDSDYLNECKFLVLVGKIKTIAKPFSDRKHDGYLILDILNDLRPKIPTNIPQDFVELMELCWHSDPKKRFVSNRIYPDSLQYKLGEFLRKAEKGEIKFPENIDTSFLPTEVNEQAIYSSRSLNPLII
ncbi:1429_t:CDS:2 [Cetraspora pellucida]|uniref:1429_t:CDS:1 n=1 Tax=Cetraspora pellucida TaxID=1433469 RepID=A0A9N8WHA3_9GLOM|nr:1429_t:CDS:2 [Cetraspora pellucida]